MADRPERTGWLAWLIAGVVGLAMVWDFLWRRTPSPRTQEPEAARPRPVTPEPAEVEEESEEIHYPDGRIEHPAVSREPSDVRFRGVLLLMLLVCLFAAVNYFVIWKFFWWQAREQEEKYVRSPYVLAPQPSRQLPREPRLEQLDRLRGSTSPDAFLYQIEQERLLHRYGPTSERGFVHIPIEQAITRLADQLPVRKEPSAQVEKQNGLVDSGEPNSGRMYRGERR